MLGAMMINRLIDFYRASSPAAFESSMSQIWQGITRIYHEELLNALKSGESSRVEQVLDRFVVSGGAHGIDFWPRVYSTSQPGIDRSLLTDAELDISAPGSDSSLLTGQVASLLYRHLGKVPEHVLEIGAGLGFLGVILNRWGTKSYTDVDLPTNAIAAAFFLSRVCGANSIRFYHEPKTQPRFANYLPSTDCREILWHQYDVIVNVNSWPEIPIHMQDSYLDYAVRCLALDGVLVSLNHENSVLGQRSMAQSMLEQKHFVLILRQPSTILQGYTQEIFQLQF